MDPRLLDILICPACKGKLRLDRQRQELTCEADHVAYPIRDGIPLLLDSAARKLNVDNSSPTTPV